MEQNSHSLQEQKHPGAEYFFQAIEMANEEATSELDLEADFFSWKVVKRRQKPQRRYTVSHAAPPAPPSTPTSLSKEHDPLCELSLSMSPTEHSSSLTTNGNGIGNGNAHGVVAENDECRLGSLLYILDYAPKYKKKLKEQQRTDAELAELFKVITITGGGGVRGSKSTAGGRSTSGDSSSKTAVEHGVSNTSRRIRRSELNAGLFRIHRNPDNHDEDSLSAPEFEAATEKNMAGVPRRCRLKVKRSRFSTREVRLAQKDKFMKRMDDELMKRMDEVVDSFDTTMSFHPSQ